MLFIKPGLFAKLETPEGLKTALQAAIELEHATIPPYLYALFSLEPNSNTEIGELIDSVVKEEMAHMAMACNILNAIGGKPAIATREFVPTYPGPLPGTVEEGLIVHLRAFSLCQLETTFMAIEEPEEPLNIPDLAEAPALTIGAFYTKIKQQIEAGGPSIFVGDPARQVTVRSFPEVIPVTDVATASSAIETIIEQGEGTSTSPLEASDSKNLAHYYRFAEIARGKKLEPAPGQKPPWRYDGPEIPFARAQVYPVVDDPASSDYPVGSPARKACEAFNSTYTSMLGLLHETFNGKPSQLGPAIGKMNELASQAENLMTIKLPSGSNAGPSFEYQGDAQVTP